MTSLLAYIGVLMVMFGLGSFYATEHFGPFNVANLIGGSAALIGAAISGLRRLRFGGGPYARPVVTRGVLLIVGAIVVGTALERLAHFAHVQYDWTFERRFELSEATLKACEELGGDVRVTLYHDQADPRTRRSRLLLRTLAAECNMETRSQLLDHDSADVDMFEIGSSNTVVIESGPRFETVARPTEGAIYEALYRLRSVRGGTIVLLRGEGEGNPESTDELGYSGLATALTHEGYDLQLVVSPALSEVPEDTKVVLSLAPKRHLRGEPLAALRTYLNHGGRLVALLEPGIESGIEELIGEFGLHTPNKLVIDPASGDVDKKVEGLNPVAYNYSTHPVTQGLDSNRMTFFAGARSFEMRKAERDDRLTGVVLASPISWITDDLSWLRKHSGTPDPAGARTDYYPLVVTAKYERNGVQGRIVAFGDSDFASNRYLRAVYNLDLVLNAVHWAAERESEITMRPKAGPPLHFPLPIADSLRTLYSVGLLVPELLLAAGGIVWLRRRAA